MRRERARKLTEHGIAAITTAIRNYPYPLTIDGIAEETGFPENSVRCLVSQMLTRGLLEPCEVLHVTDGDGIARTYPLYRLSPTP